jgi:hypothetical protein
MKKFKILLAGKVNVLADTEDQAIDHAEKEIKSIHSKFNVGIFAISETKGEEE